MDKYLIRKPRTQDSSPVQDSSSSSKRIRIDFNLENLSSDPGLRQKISSYHPNNHDEIRRHYLTKGPCQPVLNIFPLSYFSEKPRRFRSDWYIERKWLEYRRGETFVTKGFKLWNQVAKLDSHAGGVNSAHSQAAKKGEDLLNEKQHIQSVLVKQSNKDKHDYRVQLNAIVDCIRFLLCRGLVFRGHDESQGSTYPPEIQKDIVNAIASETSKAIIKDLDNGFFSILVDESRDISVKEQMSLRFLGIVHVASTTALSLKCVIECLLCEHNLSLSNLHGQGYDGASNMQGDINGLKTLILKENKLAFYIHCFAHQLQLTLIAVAKNHINIAEFFYVVSNLGSYYGTILNLILMFSAVVDVLEIIEEDGLFDQKVEARSIIRSILSFEFVFALHLMKNILGITNEFGRSRRNTQQKTNLHHYRVKLFYIVIDMQLQEFNNRFSKANADLLLCMACLNPSNSFVAFNKENNNFFLELQGVSELAEKLVSTRKHETYPLVYLLVKLALTLPVATATIERNFSAMKYIKNELRNRMGDQWMNDCLIVYIEKDVACSIVNETIMQRFQNMKTRRRHL
ncbi:hypothetical protein RGQ29_030664 [Quercus rubra]|uniref:Uncharacterized protein n=1 Tax=Quercus rubra TaxID=3512 RepID=A0AAN7EJ01_QUERU|nr:hypothetical protein RGQ29_030664 [Quercus rubra]